MARISLIFALICVALGSSILEARLFGGRTRRQSTSVSSFSEGGKSRVYVNGRRYDFDGPNASVNVVNGCTIVVSAIDAHVCERIMFCSSKCVCETGDFEVASKKIGASFDC